LAQIIGLRHVDGRRRVMASVNPCVTALTSALARVRSGSAGRAGSLAECFNRIETCEPLVRALLPDPCWRARVEDAATGNVASHCKPLHGLLLGVKDVIAVEGFSTRCGSALPPELHGLSSEAVAVTKLRAAGMTVLGKTVTTEFAGPDAGATANPWDLRRTPGGSSSGSAAAVAAGMVHCALGTQTKGSIGRPAAFCGVCGFKPTFGRVPMDGIAVYSPSADTIGTFTPNASDAALVAATLIDCWDSTAHDDIRATGPPVLGVPGGAYLQSFSKESLDHFWAALDDFARAGICIERVHGVMDDFGDVTARHEAMTMFEWARTLSGRWASHGSHFRSKSATEMTAGLAVSEETAASARQGRCRLRGQLEAAMDAAGVDLWITPGTMQGIAPMGLSDTGDARAQLPFTHAGLPTCSLPSGLALQASGPPLPVAVQLAARFGQDEALLAWCAHLEACSIAHNLRPAADDAAS